jgi:hypothetical protein
MELQCQEWAGHLMLGYYIIFDRMYYEKKLLYRLSAGKKRPCSK